MSCLPPEGPVAYISKLPVATKTAGSFFISFIMSKPVYTSIPPTTDNVYWMLKFSDGKTSIYVPRDRELDRKLKIKFQAEVAARTSPRRKK